MRNILGRLMLLLVLSLPVGIALPAADASAQVRCPAQNGAFNDFVQGIGGRPNECVPISYGLIAYDNPTINDFTNFALYLPGPGRPGDTNPAKVTFRNSLGAYIPVTTILCAGATISGTGTSVGTIALSDGGSCTLSVSWQNGDNNITFSGATLSRNGILYSVNGNGVLSGDLFGQSRPEIDITRDGVPIASGGTDAQGEQIAGERVTLTYTVVNTGNGPLFVDDARLSNRVNISISGDGEAVVPPGQDGPVTFTYTPTAAGAFRVDVTLLSNDADEGEYTITISGTAQPATAPAPEIDISRDGVPIANGGTDAQGDQIAGVPVTLTYTIANTGNGLLAVDDISNSNAANVSDIGGDVAANLPPGQNRRLILTYTPTAVGAFSFDVTYSSNDADEGEYTITVSGTALPSAPEIDISRDGVPIASGGTDAQDDQFAGVPVTLRYTFTNPGNALLTVDDVNISNVANVSNINITGGGVANLPPGQNGQLILIYTPTGAGAFSFDVTFLSNDADEGEYTITVSGTAQSAPPPEIDVTRGDTPIASGGTDAQGVQVAGTEVTLTYTVTNTGNGPLVLTRIDFGARNNLNGVVGSTIDDFVVPPGQSRPLTIFYTPIAVGPFNTTISIISNDADEPEYAITISGTTPAPEIDITRGDTPIASGGTDAQGDQFAGVPVTLRYTFTNTGDALLFVNNVELSNNANVSISGDGEATVPPGQNRTVTYTYTPTAVGAFNFDLTFETNDADEGEYTITISGTAQPPPAPEIEITRGDTPIASGGTDAQGDRAVGTEVTLTYTVTNTGNAPLVLEDPRISNNSANVSVSGGGNATVPPGQDRPVTFTYTPTAVGAFNFDLTFLSNDADEPEYAITVSGTATAPEIDITRNGAPIASGVTDAQGDQVVGVPVALTYTIANTGNGPLVLNDLLITNNANVTITGDRDDLVPPGQDRTATFTYTPTAAGAFRFDLTFFSNDADEGEYTITVSGTARAPEIDVTRGDTPIANGGTDAQGDQLVGVPVTLRYTITNTGNQRLFGDDDFRTSSNPAIITVSFLEDGVDLMAGQSAPLTVTYTPLVAGAFDFTVTIPSNDADEGEYTITISGNARAATAPEIDIQSDAGTPIANGGSLVDVERDIGFVSVPITIVNTGNAPLNVTAITTANPENVDLARALPGFIVPAGAQVIAGVNFTTRAVGAFSFDMTIASDDADEGTYTITVSGTARVAPAPEIDVRRGDTPIASGGTDAQGDQVIGTPVTLTYTVANTGNARLVVDDITTSANPTNVTISPLPTDFLNVPADDTRTFEVTYRPTAAGVFNFDVTIVSTDTDEATYTITVSGTARAATTPAPEFVVRGVRDGPPIANGDTLVVEGDPRVGFSNEASIFITLTGNAPLNLAPVRLTNPVNVVPLNDIPGLVVLPGFILSISYTPIANGPFSFDVTIASDDADADEHTITVSGTARGAPAPEIDVARGGATIADDGTDALGSRTVGTTETITYTVENTGSATLNVSGITSANPSANVRVDTISPTDLSVAAGTTATFEVSYTPTAAGDFNFELDIVSDDSNEANYDITVSGTAQPAPAPEIDVSIDGAPIFSGGTVAVDDALIDLPVILGFSVLNTGNGPLNFGRVARANLNNVDVSQAELLRGDSTLAAGESTGVNVVFVRLSTEAFSFDLIIPSDDADEPEYTITISGAAQAPDIDVQRGDTPIASGGADPQGNQVVGTPVTLTYSVANTGNRPLNVSEITTSAASDNVEVDTISPTGLTVPVNASRDFNVTYTPKAEGEFRFTVTLPSDDADEAAYTITVRGTAQPAPAPEIAVQRGDTLIADDGTDAQGDQIAGRAATITYTVTNAGNAPLDVASITSAKPANVTVSAISATEFTVAAGDRATFDVTYTSDKVGPFSFELDIASNDADEANYDIRLVGRSLAGEAVRQRTKRIIANFLARRADQVTANEPDLTNRLGGAGAGGGGPVALTGDGGLKNNRFAFATSLRQIIGSSTAAQNERRRELGQMMALGSHSLSGAAVPQSGFDVWVKGTWSRLQNESAENDLGIVHVGADYRFGPNLTIGVLGQFDWTNEKDNTENYKIEGNGWMVGPYVVARLHQNLIFDGRAAWGQSSNRVSPLASYTDDFDGDRWLVKGQFTGNFQFGDVQFAPHVGVLYFEETQKAYTDSLGNVIDQQSVALGRVTFGPRISTTVRSADGTTIAPFVSLKGIWDFESTDLVDITTGLAATGNDKLRGRTEAGVAIRLPDGLTLTGEGFYDGIGAKDYEAYGGNVTVRVPF